MIATSKEENLFYFKRELTNFGVEVFKYPKYGKPEPRAIILSTEPLELFWVGKGGKRHSVRLSNASSIKVGVNGTYPIFPSDLFKKKGTPENCDLYLTITFHDEERASLDLEFANREQRDLMVEFLVSATPALQKHAIDRRKSLGHVSDSDDENKS